MDLNVVKKKLKRFKNKMYVIANKMSNAYRPTTAPHGYVDMCLVAGTENVELPSTGCDDVHAAKMFVA